MRAQVAKVPVPTQMLQAHGMQQADGVRDGIRKSFGAVRLPLTLPLISRLQQTGLLKGHHLHAHAGIFDQPAKCAQLQLYARSERLQKGQAVLRSSRPVHVASGMSDPEMRPCQ